MQGNPDRDDSDAVEVLNPQGRGAALILCEHASNHIPARYDGLGLKDSDRTSHAAWDPGARDVALGLMRALDAPMIASTVSRLVYDCNRPPEAPSAMPERSEVIEVPGNRDLSAAARAERVRTVYTPFCDAVSALIATRKAAGLVTHLITIHSFTPLYFGKPRDCEIGILHDSDSRLADAMLNEAHRLPGRVIRRNDPYGPDDGVTHSLKLHGITQGLPNGMIELRNDLLIGAEAHRAMIDELLTLLRPAMAKLDQQARGGTHA
ncbi:MAG: N-formylglutamate amidohydrolase [Roseovarius sp.]|jgi:predicted N-formylglutamate amidohydrolase|nr:N-formylglutamate amidohydrolase [Roseovarius sp.]